MNKKVILLILDGWGNTQHPSISGPEKAETPFMDFFNDTATTEIYTIAYTLSLHDALP
eukprot:COSAG01_NODE_71418_length_256_cov_0.528662_1_plen_57_part_01